MKRIVLPRLQWNKLGLAKPNSERTRELVSCAIYLGYGLLEIQSLVEDPARAQEAAGVIRAAHTLGFTQNDLVLEGP